MQRKPFFSIVANFSRLKSKILHALPIFVHNF
ncbi:hypothetical protein EZS27_018156, partial [termite gut metagenome]